MKLERKFAKELTANERKETAEKIWEARKKPEKLEDLKGVKNLPEEYESFSDIKENFEQIKKDIFGKLFKSEKFKEREATINQLLKIKKDSDIREIRREYDKKFTEILKHSPLTTEEREKYLNTKSMEQMPLEDYLTLLKRLSGEAFYHVTRYGVRENTFISTGCGHTKSEGEFLDNLIPLLKNKNIHSCTSTIISDDREGGPLSTDYIERIKKYKSEGKSEEEILDFLMKNYDTEYFLDRDSSHFSYGRDLHHMYGGENNYKFYFYYPVEYILQNDFYQKTREGSIQVGHGYSLNQSGIEQQYNDFEIFNFGKGVPINAGILCISGNLNVDPETGSQYLLKDGKPIKGEDGQFLKPENTITSKEYWENYFIKHPELKPSKIIYDNFRTSSSNVNPELKDWAESKKISNQDENRKQEFEDYVSETRVKLREIFSEIVKEI